MTDNTQELDPIINIMDMWDFSPLQDEDTRRERVYKEIQAHTNKQIEAYHNELTDNEKKVWIYADDLEKRKTKAVEEVLDRLCNVSTAVRYCRCSGITRGETTTVTLYSKGCTPCLNKHLWKQLKTKAAEKRVLLQRKDVRKDPQAKQDADNLYGRATPFVVLDGKDMSVEEFLR